jgi:hypothetical protein
MFFTYFWGSLQELSLCLPACNKGSPNFCKGRQVIDQFFQMNIAGTGWDVCDAADLHELFRSLLTGDIVFLKSCSYSSDITVKGVGVVADNMILQSYHNPLIGIGRNIRWLSQREFRIIRPTNTKNNVRGNTIYQEFHPDVVTGIMREVERNIIHI